jgi:hypothetical protein
MQLYCNTFVCNYMQLCNMQLMKLKQLYGTYATLRNFIATYATILQLYETICNLCNYIATYATYATILQLYATICN